MSSARLTYKLLPLSVAVGLLAACVGSPNEALQSKNEQPELHDLKKEKSDLRRGQRERDAKDLDAQAVITSQDSRPDAAAPAELAALARLANTDFPQSIVASESEAKSNVGAAMRNATALYNVAPGAPSVDKVNRENYAHIVENAMKLTAQDPVSTFSIDVDTGAYANVRRFLANNQLPPQDAVRVEELINYFNYDYPTPTSDTTPFSVTTEVATTPWNPDTLLMQVGLKGYEIPNSERPATNLIFLLDVSGSMNRSNKLPLLKKSFDLLTQQLNADDRISIVVYAGASGVVLEPTPGDQRDKILESLDRLRAGGSTNGAAGIQLAYQMAEQAYIEDGINRIILATDGDFNVGTTDFDSLVDLAERKRQSGVSLTTLGFGTGNYNDHLMEQLADAGNGNYAYIDTLQEARKVLVQEMSSTLMTIAEDVKIQVEFNPNVIAHYRLIGYENRALKQEDFNNDAVDAGEIGAGHTVTALYELTPVGSVGQVVDPLRYAPSKDDHQSNEMANKHDDEIAFLKLRFKQPGAQHSTKISYPISLASKKGLEHSSDNLRFSAAVAAFGQIIRGSDYTAHFSMSDVQRLAHGAMGPDLNEYRAEFLDLVERGDRLLSESSISPAIAQTD